jgi:sterol desaturase/sphingolipid hydroxylase (fatty acid hydroxylase superfamily)
MAVTALCAWFLNIVLGDEFVLMLGMFVIVGLIEYFFPAQPVPRRHYWLNLSYGFVNIFLVSTLLLPVSAGVAYAIQGIGFGFIDLRALGLEGLTGSLVAVLVGTAIWDFLQYWEHRLYHGSQIFWQMHLLHHSDEHMNVTTATRHHVFENLLAPFFVTLPTAILFQVPPVDIAILSLLPYTWVYLTHANINFGFGPVVVAAGEPQLPSRSSLACRGAHRSQFRQLVSDLGHHFWYRGCSAMERMPADRCRRRDRRKHERGLSAAVQKLATDGLEKTR